MEVNQSTNQETEEDGSFAEEEMLSVSTSREIVGRQQLELEQIEGSSKKVNHKLEGRSPEIQEFSDTEVITSMSMYCDVSHWPIPIPDSLRVNLIKTGVEAVQNKEGPFATKTKPGEKSKGNCRQLTTSWFYRSLPNSEKVLRTWLVYSPAKESLFCFCCRLFASSETEASISKFITGFQAWWKLNPKVADHENSERHLSNLEKWKTLKLRLKLMKTIDDENQQVEEKARRKWRDILLRLLDVTLFLANQNLAVAIERI